MPPEPHQDTLGQRPSRGNQSLQDVSRYFGQKCVFPLKQADSGSFSFLWSSVSSGRGRERGAGVLRFWMLTRCRDCCEGPMLTRLGEKAGAAPALSCAVAAGVPPQPAQPHTSTWGPCAESPLTKQWLPGAPGRPSSGEVSS